MEQKIAWAYVGLRTDNILSQLKEGVLSFAKNAMLENFDGNMITYQNEISNYHCMDLPAGFHVIGVKNIIEQNRTIFFLVNPNTGDCEIGQKTSLKCEPYQTIISSTCLNFKIDWPIHQVEVKTTDCSTQIYWTDGFNPMRWMDLDDLPFVEVFNPDNEFDPIKIIGQVDCNKLLVQPKFSIPKITYERIEVGGSLVMGTYQFAIQYANSLQQGLTSMYAITDDIQIFDPNKVTSDFNLPTTKSIEIVISDIDTTGLYDHFNIIVLKNINGIVTPYIAATLPITQSSTRYVYTGNDQTELRLTMGDVFERFPYYDTAQDIASTDNTLMWANLKKNQTINYQQIWSKVKMFWQSHVLSYDEFEAYNNAVNTAEFRGYMRDEPYALEGVFLLDNGEITEAGHIPGRAPFSSDLEIVDNKDAQQSNNPCEEPISKKRYQVYNTATVIGFTDQYQLEGNTTCYKGSYQYGEFGYWESTETYPNNKFIWGDLAGQKIRHHLMPDCLVSPIHDSNPTNDPNFVHKIYPLGVRIDSASLYQAIQDSDLTEDQKARIVGFKILRGNRATNKSVIAKGLLYNVGQYKYEGQNYFYPNYPFNDLRPDPFLSSIRTTDHTGRNESNRLQGFGTDDSRQRFTFHSPDTSFSQPFGIDTGLLKLETVEYGKSRSHFVEVKDNAKYKFLTRDILKVAYGAAMASIVGVEIGGGFGTNLFSAQASIHTSEAPAAFTATYDLLRNIIPSNNYGWAFHGIGDYNSTISIPNAGNKIRNIELGRYLIPGMQAIPGDKYSINNVKRESSVYLKTADTFPFPHEAGAPEDQSRWILSDRSSTISPNAIEFKDISSYYASIKRLFPDQWGRMYSYETIDTGFYHRLLDDNNQGFKDFPTVFGGDIFINRFGIKRKLPFFLDYTVGQPDETDINLDDLSNVAYAIFYYSTKPIDIDINFDDIDGDINTLTNFGIGTVLGNLVSGGTKPLFAGIRILTRIFTAYMDTLGVSDVNLDQAETRKLYEIGKAYLFAYGIPYFFVESETNVDNRQAYNSLEGDFYPHVSSDIPDDWLQEVNVPIIRDNTYTYNRSFYKQNKETSFSHLREDFDPNKTCFTNFENRIIYSQKASLEETKNNWLVYRPVSYFEFPKNYGPLTAVNGLEDRKLLVRFVNKSLLYNVMATVQTSTTTAFLGDPGFFNQPPIDFAETDLGYNGSQHKFFIRTEAGHLSIDAERGQIFLYRGNQLKEISAEGMSRFFTANLPFRIKQYFPDINIDNHFKDVGLTGTYDNLYSRLIITKKDFIPLVDGIQYIQGTFYVNDSGTLKEVSINDPEYFCDISWTLSYSLSVSSWISFHSYIPNFYIQQAAGIFETGSVGTNQGQPQVCSVWKHNDAITFGSFYGRVEDYVIEYPLNFQPEQSIIQSFSDYTTVYQYETKDVYTEISDGIYFNQAVIYNAFQCTGYLNLIPKPKNNLSVYLKYPKYNQNSKDILVTKSDNLFSFNQFWDITAEEDKPFFSRPCSIPSLDKIFDRNLDYTKRPYKKDLIRSNETKIRLIYNKSDQYKLISKFTITESQKSIK